MNDNTETSSSRIFKTAWFAKAAKKALITNEALCLAIQQVILGQTDDLGGGVFKKRLNNNRHRSIILPRVVGTGFIPIFLQRKTGITLAVMS